jgi:hypothetical protein
MAGLMRLAGRYLLFGPGKVGASLNSKGCCERMF